MLFVLNLELRFLSLADCLLLFRRGLGNMNQENIAVKIAKQEEACEQRMLDGLDRLLEKEAKENEYDSGRNSISIY